MSRGSIVPTGLAGAWARMAAATSSVWGRSQALPPAPNASDLVVASVMVRGSRNSRWKQDQWKSIVDLTQRNHRTYCARWGYKYVVWTEAHEANREAQGGVHADEARWLKVPFILGLLTSGRARTVFWMDSDSVFTNRELPLHGLPPPAAEFTFALSPRSLLNAGHFFVRNTPWAVALLRKVLAAQHDSCKPWSRCRKCWPWGGGGDNPAFTYLLTGSNCSLLDGLTSSESDNECVEALSRLHSELRTRVGCLPERAINSIPPWSDGQGSYWHRGDLILHVPGFTYDSTSRVSFTDILNAGIKGELSREWMRSRGLTSALPQEQHSTANYYVQSTKSG